MLTAIAKAHWPKVWAAEGGMELPVINLATAVGVSITGTGTISLDHAFGTALTALTGSVTIAGWVVVVLGWLVAMAVPAKPAELSKSPSH